MKLALGNTHLWIEDAKREELSIIDGVTSYPVKDAWFSSAFRSKRWDGKEHLLTYSSRFGYRVHAGCTSDVINALREKRIPFTYADRRCVPESKIDHKWTGVYQRDGKWQEIVVRDYQAEAATAILEHDCPPGRCMVRMPVRSGKTVLGATLIASLGIRTLFLTTSDLLLDQTVKLYRNLFDSPIGIIGGGVWEPTELTVATIQTINARVGEDYCRRFLDSCELVIFDECHHLKATKWKEVALSTPAYWKIGLSATIYLDHAKANERENIWLKACTGDIVYSVTTKRMIDEGWLVKPTIEMYVVQAPQITGDWTGDEVYRRGVVMCEPRNKMVVQLAAEAARDGSRVMVMAQQHDQIDVLHDAIARCGITVEKLTGRVTGDERRNVVKHFKKGVTQVIVGNVFGEGVDIPEVDVVINAEGGESRKRTIQRLRNLTPSPGKDKVRVIDFADTHNSHLAKHSRARLKTYRDEEAFEIVMKSVV